MSKTTKDSLRRAVGWLSVLALLYAAIYWETLYWLHH